ncbi:uncharacterized protein CCOS01_17118, partial [Colletotrichum costaricense]
MVIDQRTIRVPYDGGRGMEERRGPKPALQTDLKKPLNDEWCLPHEDDSEIIKEHDSASLTALRILEREALPLFHYMEIQECVKNGWASRLRICTKFIQFGTYLRIPLETVHLA